MCPTNYADSILLAKLHTSKVSTHPISDPSYSHQLMKVPSSPRRKRGRPSSASLLIILAFIVFAAVLYSEDITCVLRHPFIAPQSPEELQQQQQSGTSAKVEEKKKKENAAFAVGETEGECELFRGRWVYDEETWPQYAEEECPYIQPQLTCQTHGRPDTGYQHWRWQPHGCSLPSFNATLMLEKLRGKRMMFVGDSLNRGQFVSMVCLLHRAIPESAKSMETFDSLTVFKAKDYNATIEFYWAPFLVESNSDNAVVHRIPDRIVRAGSINKHAKYWKGSDILVLNTYLWWMTGSKMKILRGSFKDEMKNITPMETEDAYRLALRRVVKWVEKNMDPQKTRVFFATMSPSHERSQDWGGEAEGNCYNQTRPIEDLSYWGSSTSKSMMQVLGEVFEKSKVPISVLNITQLSEYRRDAHTQIYKQQWNPLTPEQIANPKSYADCNHWCLPGLQDTWNELLYTKLFFP